MVYVFVCHSLTNRYKSTWSCAFLTLSDKSSTVSGVSYTG